MGIADGQRRLRKIAQHLKVGTALADLDRRFIASALAHIADGEDAEAALGVKAKRGEKKGKNARKRKTISEMALAWIAAAKLPEEEGGLGLTLEEARAKIGENGLHAFGLTEETLKTYWAKKKTRKTPNFHLED